MKLEELRKLAEARTRWHSYPGRHEFVSAFDQHAEALLDVVEAAYEAMLDLNHIRCDGGKYEGPGGDREVATKADDRLQDVLAKLEAIR